MSRYGESSRHSGRSEVQRSAGRFRVLPLCKAGVVPRARLMLFLPKATHMALTTETEGMLEAIRSRSL